MTRPVVELLVLSRDESPLAAAVDRGLRSQQGVDVLVHRITGVSSPTDANRWETIARARNEAKRLASQRWVMFVDDDVVLDHHCVRQLLAELQRRPNFGALAANYRAEPTLGGRSPHVAMGATLFRREALSDIEFRWRPGKCECQCCCDDLRRLGYGIAYYALARAVHLQPQTQCIARTTDDLIELNPRDDAASASVQNREPVAGRVLVAFNRRHFTKFREHFLATLRYWENDEQVTVIGYGLYPREQRILRALPRVDLVSLPDNGIKPPIRRLTDFQMVLESMPGDTPVAYWDAGDVIFQSRLTPLWELVEMHSDRLLAVREPKGFPENAAVVGWTRTIHDPQSRRRAFELFATNPFLNSGFVAGTAAVMLRYFREASRYRYTPALRGTADWGDQTALNLYCHSQPSRWLEIEQGWNYCLHDRCRGEVHVRPDGFMVSRLGVSIHVAHGNAHSHRKLALLTDQMASVRNRHAGQRSGFTKNAAKFAIESS